MKTYIGDIINLKKNQIFVFGSNTQGRHGKGSALLAKNKFGAKYGQAEGLQGQSYAIVTKDLTKFIHPSRTKDQIKSQIKKLYDYAEKHNNLEFFICYKADSLNNNNYTSEEMLSMFKSFIIPDNIIFNKEFLEQD